MDENDKAEITRELSEIILDVMPDAAMLDKYGGVIVLGKSFFAHPVELGPKTKIHVELHCTPIHLTNGFRSCERCLDRFH